MSFNERFESTEGNHVLSFFESEYKNYAVYKVLQRLPHMLDTLASTQRKLITVLEKRPQARKIKTAETYGMVYNEMKYIHGDASVFTTSESLSRGATNNINIFTEEGNFGFRTNRSAAGPRYTNTRFSEAARLIFRAEDKPILGKQEFEGAQIEAPFLLPIVPVAIMNGQDAIAIGFASKILPHHPIALIDSMIKALKRSKKIGPITQKMIAPVPIDFPYFSGTSIADPNKPSNWTMSGIVKWAKRKHWVEISEVPPSFTRESYLKKLKKLLEKGIIKEYSESCVKNKFNFMVKMSPDYLDKTELGLLRVLGLTDTTQENFTFIFPEDEDNPIKIFETVEEYLVEFLTIRLSWYGIRKNYILSTLSDEIDSLKERIRFIHLVNNGDIQVTKRKKVDLEKELAELDFNKLDSSYDYLLGMRLWNLTAEMQEKYQKTIRDKEKELEVLNSTTSEDMYINELQEFKKFIQPELKKKKLID